MSKPVDGHSSNPEKSIGRRLWWGLAAFGIVLLAVFGAVLFEAVTGHFSGTVMQVRIDECSPRKVSMTAFRLPGSNSELHFEWGHEPLVEVQPPKATDPILATLRERLWEKCLAPSTSFSGSFDPIAASAIYYVEKGDVFQLRPSEKVTVMNYELGTAL